MTEDSKKTMARLQALCARQECCSRDIYAKALKKCGGDEDEAAEILGALKEDGFVDDLRYASAFCREKSSLTGWGPYKIRCALAAKGISSADITEALGAIDSAAAGEKLAKLLAVKAKSLEGDPQARLKLIRFALSRGYDYPQVEQAMKSYTRI